MDVGTGCRDMDAWEALPLQEIEFDPDPGPRVGAPTVVRADGLYKMWFSEGNGGSIRYAYTDDANCTADDCRDWILREESVLTGLQT